MFANLQPQPADAILALMQLFRDDPRTDKIDLGVGVYKDATGLTPIMRAVKTAEQQVWDTQDSKTYVGLVGDPLFCEAMTTLVLGSAGSNPEAIDRDRIAAAATPGGTGAVRQALEMVRMAEPGARVFVSVPTWPNHLSILDYLGFEVVPYRYFDAQTRGVDFPGMMADLAQLRRGDVLLLHGCCHNPTGANLTPDQWDEVIGALQQSGATAMIDIAYQGFGDGLDADAEATRKIASAEGECLIAASCSKNFGIYRERTGVLLALSEPGAQRRLNQDTLAFLNRQNYSFPPDHGARLVTTILNDSALRADWARELEQMRTGMLSLREGLANALRRETGSDRFGFLAAHRGMFSLLGASPAQVERLRAEHGVYMVSDSRMNIAGLNASAIPRLAAAIAKVGI